MPRRRAPADEADDASDSDQEEGGSFDAEQQYGSGGSDADPDSGSEDSGSEDSGSESAASTQALKTPVAAVVMKKPCCHLERMGPRHCVHLERANNNGEVTSKRMMMTMMIK